MDSINEIKQHIIDWVKNNLGESFTFRKYQLESIIFIIKSIITDNRETSIIEAPTGSGKSIISIISAGVLSDYYKKSSYILCSDLFLWQQYVDLIDNKNLRKFGYIKGALGNYKCFVNRMDLSCGKCKLAKVSYKQLSDRSWREKNYFTCVDNCVYMQQRFRAQRSDITLMTYQLWFHHMNLVNIRPGVEQAFPKRDVIFCDECHNIPNLVQQFCTPVLKDTKDIKRLTDILEYAEENNIQIKEDINNLNFTLYKPEYLNSSNKKTNNIHNNKQTLYYNDVFDTENICDKLKIIFNSLELYNSDVEQIIDIMNLFFNILDIVSIVHETLENDIQHETLFNTANLDKKLLNKSTLLSWFTTYRSRLLDFFDAVKKSGNEYMLLEISTDNETRERTYMFNCVKEDYLCSEYLLSHANNKVLLSATVGSHKSFDDNIGIKYTTEGKSYMSKIPSTFNFDKSPIYFIPTYKMNYANKAVDFPKIQELALKIMRANYNKRGIIHTGSYENAKLFFNNVPKELRSRLFLYGNPKQKEEIMPDFKNTTNGILVGPTLTEGVDLPNDYCRFIIIMKVPYPNITSKIVKKKLELFPLWYNTTTSNVIIQSIGRGVRNDNDYCTTYILDGCFGQLYNTTIEQYPDHIKNRLKIIKS